jgi:hypothetical protein
MIRIETFQGGGGVFDFISGYHMVTVGVESLHDRIARRWPRPEFVTRGGWSARWPRFYRLLCKRQ